MLSDIEKNIEDEYASWSRKTKIENLINDSDKNISYEIWLKDFLKSHKSYNITFPAQVDIKNPTKQIILKISNG